MTHKKTDEGYPIFRSYLEEENDKPYYSMNTLSFYYEDMERKQKLIEDLAKAIVGYDHTLTGNLAAIEKQVAERFEQWDEKLKTFDGSVMDLLQEWVDDGTMDHIVDSSIVDRKLEPITAQLAKKANNSEVRKKNIQIGLADLNSETISAIEGGEGTTFNLLSIPRESSVSPDKTTFFELSNNLFDKSTVTKGHFIRYTDGVVATSATYSASDWIPASPNTEYVTSHSYQKAFYDETQKFISGQQSGTNFITPSNCHYIRFSLLTSVLDVFQVEKGNVLNQYTPYYPPRLKSQITDIIKQDVSSSLSQSIKDDVINEIGDVGNKLTGLKWGVIGDSISTLNYRAGGQEYPGKIAIDNNMALNNLAIPGSMITKSNISSHLTSHMCEKVLELNDNCDIVTVMGGVNDRRNNRPLGVMGSTDIETFYGAMDLLCRNLIIKFPTKPKAIFTPIKFRNNEETMKPFVNAIKEVAARYSIPVLDLFTSGDLQPDLDIINDTYFYNSDGIHPLANGHSIIARRVENFLRTLV